MQPGLSVVIPLFNKAGSVKRCLDSIPKDFANIEIIVVDDGSTDDSLEVVREYASKTRPLNILSQVNSGPSSARNKGSRESVFSHIIYIDADDVFLPGAMELFLDLIAMDSDVDLAFTSFQEIGTSLKKSVFLISDKISFQLDPNEWTAHNGKFESGLTQNIQAGSFMISNSLFNKIEGFNEQLRCWEVTHFLVKAIKSSRKTLLKDTITVESERQEGNSLFEQRKDKTEDKEQYIKALVPLIYDLSNKERYRYIKEIEYLLYYYLQNSLYQQYRKLALKTSNLIQSKELKLLGLLPAPILSLLWGTVRRVRK